MRYQTHRSSSQHKSSILVLLKTIRPSTWLIPKILLRTMSNDKTRKWIKPKIQQTINNCLSSLFLLTRILEVMNQSCDPYIAIILWNGENGRRETRRCNIKLFCSLFIPIREIGGGQNRRKRFRLRWEQMGETDFSNHLTQLLLR